MKKQTNYERYGNYIINRQQSLGSGTFGKVYKGYQIISQNSFGNYQRLRLQPIAIKQSFCQQSNYQQINILKILNHPNIIKYIDYKVHGNSLFMIMQICQQGTLQDLLMQMPENENLNDLLMLLYAQVVAGIKFMYDKNILHRDIKPSNILIKDNIVKIADFGTSKLKQGKQLRTLVGTPLFSSPQLLQISLPSQQQQNLPIKSTYTEKSDIWSLGLVLYMMFNYQRDCQQQGERLRRSLPWSGKHAGEVLKNIYTQPLTFRNNLLPQNIMVIITKMLKINPQQRMTFKELFQLTEFQPPKVKQLRINLNESNLAISRTFLPENSLQYGDQQQQSLYNGKKQQQNNEDQGHKVLSQIQKKHIDNELMKLLQIKDSQHYEQDEIKQAIEFYTLLLDGLKGVINSNVKVYKQEQEQTQQNLQKHNEQQLMFLLQKKLYELQSWRLWHIDYLRKLQLQDSVLLQQQKGTHLNNNNQQHKTIQKHNNNSHNTIAKIDYEIISQLINNIQQHYSQKQQKLLSLKSTINDQVFLKIVQKPDTEQLLSKQKIIVNFIKPDNKLLNSIKIYIKNNVNQQLFTTFTNTNNKIKCNMTITPEHIHNRHIIYFIYDLFIAIEFQYSWRLKGKLDRGYGKRYNLSFVNSGFFSMYKSVKERVNVKQIIARVKLAYDSLKIAAVKGDCA